MSNEIETSERLQLEWDRLHQDHERYDRSALFIKLAAIICSLLSLAYALPLLLAFLFVLTLWLQEGIWRTFQSRLADRLLIVESALANNQTALAFQLYSSWEENRPSTLGLIKSYIGNSVRPTVAFPYVILLCIEIASYGLISS